MCNAICQIEWIDMRTRRFTPDKNPAIGYASIRGEDFLICAAHRSRMPASSWSFTPFSDLAL
jgi:hypothetical protein